MSMSGIKVDPAVTGLYNDMKMHHSHKYALFRIEGQQVVVDDKAELQETTDREADRQCFKEMVSQLATDQPRYILYNFGFTTREGRVIQKVAFIFWNDDNGSLMQKMTYASTKDTVKKEFTGLSLEFQATNKAGLDYDAISEEVEQKA